LTQLLVEGAQSLGFTVQNSSFFPIVSIMIGHIEPLIKACQILWKHNILITPAYYPVVPFNASALRFSITAANTKDQIEQALEGLYEISTHLKMVNYLYIF
jgi:7-keto-8-aminopelargonate synthetase and related enzymes